MFNDPYINFHTHHPSGSPDVLEIENLNFGQQSGGKTPFYSAGLHPWFLAGIDLQEAESWLHRHLASPHCLALGEAGLDKLTTTPQALQTTAFECCIRLAAETGKPLVIHCVRAFHEVLKLLENAPAKPVSIFHGFDKHPKIAAILLDAGCFLSFGAALFRANSPAADTLRKIPADRFFLETDDKSLNISTVYERAAEIRGVDTENIRRQVAQNFRNLPGVDVSLLGLL